jgi:hypothetical protein
LLDARSRRRWNGLDDVVQVDDIARWCLDDNGGTGLLG